MVEFPEFVDLMSRRPYGFRGSEGELSAAFSPFDKDATGIVNMAGLRRALTTLGEPLRDDELDDMFGKVEVDGDGNVEYKGNLTIFQQVPACLSVCLSVCILDALHFGRCCRNPDCY